LSLEWLAKPKEQPTPAINEFLSAFDFKVLDGDSQNFLPKIRKSFLNFGP